MKSPDEKLQPEDGQHDLSRLPPKVNVEGFLESIRALQVPCPWGDLTKGEGIQRRCPDVPGSEQIPYIPLGLVVGAGHNPQEIAYRSVTSVNRFGKIIYSDVMDPHMRSRDCMHLDLTNPAEINLFGLKVHALMSIGVFTYDRCGVSFMDRTEELEAAKALADMLMPGGILANDNLNSSTRFERIFLEQFGFQLVRDTRSIILQKSF